MGRITDHRTGVVGVVLTATLLSTTGCADDGAAIAEPPGTLGTLDITRTVSTEPPHGGGGGGGGGGGRFARALEPFDDCAAFLGHVKAEAAARVGPYGLNPDGGWYFDEPAAERAADVEAAAEEPAEEPAMEPAAPTGGTSDDDAGGGDGSGTYTDTNVQEVGVDEPDIIKTDGDRILVIRDGRLIHVDIAGDAPRITDEIRVPDGWAHELFFLGDRAILFTHSDAFDRSRDDADPHAWYAPAATITEVDLSVPTEMRITATLDLEGQYLSARRIDDKVRMAISTGPQQLPWVMPQGWAGEERAERTNRELIAESTIADWIPEFRLEAGGAETAGSLVPCERMHHPADFSGFDVVSLLEIDLTEGLAQGFDPAAPTGVLAGGQTVYSSLDRFYIATTKWTHADDARDGIMPPQWSEDYETEMHAFAIAPEVPARYVASGSVSGSLLNQFSLDEHDGFLRVITTDGSPWDGSNLSESSLTVLEEQGDRLVAIGTVGGLGKGESLYSARLLDDIGFAVTFRQIDPFYVLDLSDPRNPRVTGELKIPGFSTYLHPLGDDRVIGIGQDATDGGQVLGLKVSLFDVSDPTVPRETAIWKMPNAMSAAEHDHRAFQMWGTTAILPVENWNGGFNGVVLLDLSDGIREIGRVSQSPTDEAPTSDCLTLTADDGLPVDSDLSWMVQDPSVHLQLCGADDRGGWHDHWCDTFPIDGVWSADPAALADALARLGATEDSRLEMCYWQGDVTGRVERSLVADGVLYILTADVLQANLLDDLSLVTTIPLR